MVKVTGSLFVALRRNFGGDRRPVAIIETVDWRLNSFGESRIHKIDPHRLCAEHDPAARARLDKLAGRIFQTLQDAGQCVSQAINPGEYTYVLSTLDCFVVGLPDMHTDTRKLLGARIEHTHRRGVRFQTRFSPALATHVVSVLPNDDGKGAGEWVSVGMLRPFAPSDASMTDDEVMLAVNKMIDKVRHALRPRSPAAAAEPTAPAPPSPQHTFEPKSKPHDKKRPLIGPSEEGRACVARREGEGTGRPAEAQKLASVAGEMGADACAAVGGGYDRKRSPFVPGNIVFVNEKGACGAPFWEHPHEIVTSELGRPEPGARSRMPLRRLKLRSLVDGSERELCSRDVASFGKAFKQRVLPHVACFKSGALCHVCHGLLRGVDIVRAHHKLHSARRAAFAWLVRDGAVQPPAAWCEAE